MFLQNMFVCSNYLIPVRCTLRCCQDSGSSWTPIWWEVDSLEITLHTGLCQLWMCAWADTMLTRHQLHVSSACVKKWLLHRRRCVDHCWWPLMPRPWWCCLVHLGRCQHNFFWYSSLMVVAMIAWAWPLSSGLWQLGRGLNEFRQQFLWPVVVYPSHQVDVISHIFS